MPISNPLSNANVECDANLLTERFFCQYGAHKRLLLAGKPGEAISPFDCSTVDPESFIRKRYSVQICHWSFLYLAGITCQRTSVLHWTADFTQHQLHATKKHWLRCRFVPLYGLFFLSILASHKALTSSHNATPYRQTKFFRHLENLSPRACVCFMSGPIFESP